MRFYMMLLALMLLVSGGRTAAANDAVGVWLTDDGKAKVELTECGTSLCSKIVWLREPKDEEGRPLRDGYNPDPKLRRRKIVGLEILKDLQPTGPNRWSGQIYNPENGKTYQAHLTVVQPNLIVLKGCTQWGWPCGEKTWRRAEPRKPGVQTAKAPARKPQSRAQAAPPPLRRPAKAPQSAVAVASVTPPAVQPRPTPPRAAAKSQSAAASPLPWHTNASPSAPSLQPRAPEITTTALPPRTQPDGAYLVQVAARQSHDAALVAFRELQQQFPNLLGRLQPDIKQADLGFKGIWYRVRVGPMGQRSAALDFCQRLKAAGGDCLVRGR